MTLAQLQDISSAVTSFPFADLLSAIAAGGKSLPDDLVLAEDIAGAAALLNVPFAADAELALEGLGLVLPLLPPLPASSTPGPDVLGSLDRPVGR
jgi:hypothetical protein